MIHYFGAFDLAGMSAWSITLTPNGGGTPIVINQESFTHPVQIHGPDIGVAGWTLRGDSNYTVGSDPGNAARYSGNTFAVNLAAMINALASAWTTPTVVTVALNLSTLRYTIARSSGATFAVAFTGGGARLFGFSGNSADAASHTGNSAPNYVRTAAAPGLGFDSGDILDDDQSSLAVSNSGGVWFSVSRDAPLYRRTWVQQYEPRNAVWREWAQSEWTYEDLVIGSRRGLPFAVYDTQAGERMQLCLLSEGGFKPEPASEGNHAQVHVSFDVWRIGTRSAP